MNRATQGETAIFQLFPFKRVKTVGAYARIGPIKMYIVNTGPQDDHLTRTRAPPFSRDAAMKKLRKLSHLPALHTRRFPLNISYSQIIISFVFWRGRRAGTGSLDVRRASNTRSYENHSHSYTHRKITADDHFLRKNYASNDACLIFKNMSDHFTLRYRHLPSIPSEK